MLNSIINCLKQSWKDFTLEGVTMIHPRDPSRLRFVQNVGCGDAWEGKEARTRADVLRLYAVKEDEWNIWPDEVKQEALDWYAAGYLEGKKEYDKFVRKPKTLRSKQPKY